MNDGVSRKIHLLGFKSADHLKFWRPHSCDSSNWTRGARYGRIDVYAGGGRMDFFTRRDYRAKLPAYVDRVRSYGLDLSEFGKAATWVEYGMGTLRAVPCASWMDYSLDAGQSIGTSIFLACNSALEVIMAVKTFDRVAPLHRGGALKPKLRVLVAFPYFSKEVAKHLAERADDIELLIDSGAFTAWKAGKTIAMDDYCRFIETLPIRPWRYFQLDVVGDHQATVKNYDEMRRRGFDPIPIFTRGAPPETLEYFYSQTDLVGVGGLVGTRGNRGFVNGVMERIGQRPAHLLGFQMLEYLKFWRPFSCDSSAWAMGERYGMIDAYRGGGRMERLTRANIAEKFGDPALVARIKGYGLDVAAFREREHWVNRSGRTTMISRLPAYAWTDYMLDVARNLGTRLFLVASSNSEGFGRSSSQVKLFLDAFDHVAPRYQEAFA